MSTLKWLARRVVKDNVNAISTDPSLRRYAWCVLAAFLVVDLFLLNTGALGAVLETTEPLCWPYFQDCWRFRLSSLEQTHVVIFVALAIIQAAAAFLAADFMGLFWACILGLSAGLFGLISLDYRLRTNEIYMLLWLSAVFLFAPAKTWCLPLVVISFYFWAGTLKLNYEWLSGAGLYSDLFLIPRDLVWLACTYVVCLELVLIWGLLARRKMVVLTTLAQLAMFHLESLSQIHWFYPALMLLILGWFVIELVSTSPPRTSLVALATLKAPVAAYLLLVLFATFQLVPLLYRGDSVLTGQGRIFALHMFEARQICEVDAVVHRVGQPPTKADLLLRELPPREICDPIVYYDRIENLCRSRTLDPGLLDVDFVMKVRRSTDPEFHTVVDVSNFCTGGYAYTWWRNNNWMH